MAPRASLAAPVSLVVKSTIRVTGQIVDRAGRGVGLALVRVDSDDIQRGRHERPVTEVMTTSDDRGSFSATVGGGAAYVISVVTAAGDVARHIVVVRCGDPGHGMVRVGTPFTRVAPGETTCDVGRIVIPSATGGLRISVAELIFAGPCEVVATPLGEIADRFPARRAAIRGDRTAELTGLPEGEYDLSVAPRGELVGMFGLRGTRVRVVDGKVLEVTLAK